MGDIGKFERLARVVDKGMTFRCWEERTIRLPSIYESLNFRPGIYAEWSADAKFSCWKYFAETLGVSNATNCAKNDFSSLFECIRSSKSYVSDVPKFEDMFRCYMALQWVTLRFAGEAWCEKYVMSCDLKPKEEDSGKLSLQHQWLIAQIKKMSHQPVVEPVNLKAWPDFIIRYILPSVLPFIVNEKSNIYEIGAAINLKQNQIHGGSGGDSFGKTRRLLEIARSLRNTNASLRLLRGQVPFDWENWSQWNVPDNEEDFDDMDFRLQNVRAFEDLDAITKIIVRHFNKHREFVNFVIDHFTRHYRLEKKGQPAKIEAVVVKGKSLDEVIEELERLIVHVNSSFSPVGKALMLRKTVKSPVENELKLVSSTMRKVYERLDILRQMLRKKGFRIFPGKLKESEPEYNALDWMDQMTNFISQNWATIASLIVSLLKTSKVDCDIPEFDFGSADDAVLQENLRASMRFMNQATYAAEKNAVKEGNADVVPTPYVWPFDGTHLLDAYMQKVDFTTFATMRFDPLEKQFVVMKEMLVGADPIEGAGKSLVAMVKDAELSISDAHKAIFGNRSVKDYIATGQVMAVQMDILRGDMQRVLTNLHGEDITARGIIVTGINRWIEETKGTLVNLGNTVNNSAQELNGIRMTLSTYSQSIGGLNQRVTMLETGGHSPTPGPFPTPSQDFSGDINGIKVRVVAVETAIAKLPSMQSVLDNLPYVYGAKNALDSLVSDHAIVRDKVNALHNADLVNEMSKLSNRVDKVSKLDPNDLDRRFKTVEDKVSSLESYNVAGLASKVATLEEKPYFDTKQFASVIKMLADFRQVRSSVAKIVQYINQWGKGKSFEGDFQPMEEVVLAQGQSWFSNAMWGEAQVVEQKNARTSVYQAIRDKDYLFLFDYLDMGFFDLPCASLPELQLLRLECNQAIREEGKLSVKMRNKVFNVLNDLQPNTKEGEPDLFANLKKGNQKVEAHEQVMENTCVSAGQNFFTDEEEEFFDAEDGFFDCMENLVVIGQNDPEVGGIVAPQTLVPAHEKELIPEVTEDVHCVVGEELMLHDTREQVLRNLHPTACVIAAGREGYPLNKTEGDVLWSFRMNEMHQQKGPFAGMFANYGVLPGGLSVLIRMNLSPLTGVGLALVYLESGTMAAKLSSHEIFSHPHIAWNPACEDAKLFTFQPMSCSNTWHPHMLLGHEGMVCLVQISNWNKALVSPFHFTWSLSYANKLDLIETVVDPLNLPRTLSYKNHIGSIDFQVNNIASLRKIEIDPAKPYIGTFGLYQSFWQSLLGSVAYWKSDILFEVVRTSSPMVSISLGLAICPGARAVATKPENLVALPHVEFTMAPKESRKIIKFPAHLCGYHLAGDGYSYLGGPTSIVGLTLMVWCLDSPTSSDGSGFACQVAVCGLTNLEVLGNFAGSLPYGKRTEVSHVQKYARYTLHANRWVIPVLNLEMNHHTMKSQRNVLANHVNGQNAQVWHQCWFWNPFGLVGPPEPSGNPTPSNAPPPPPDFTPSYPAVRDKSIQFVLNGFKPSVLLQPDGEKLNNFIVASPTVRILNSCVWAKGTLLYRFVWAGKFDIKSGDWMGSVKVAVHGEHTQSLRNHLFTSSTRSGFHEFAIDIVGPVNGFYNLESMLEYAMSPSVISIVIGCPIQFEYCELYVAFSPGCRVVGAGASIIGGTIPGTRAAGFAIVT